MNDELKIWVLALGTIIACMWMVTECTKATQIMECTKGIGGDEITCINPGGRLK